ncbi:TRAP transporter large permease [Desertibaculum subflavum]|uniref:TRAP transporter large permease n=1 Tax=Desertibaculum subflavum TaxID=2268458 RepID=UPI000E663005
MWDWLADHLSVVMFAALTFIMFCGYPVAYVLGGVGLGFGALGILLDVFQPVQFFNIIPRIWGQAVQNGVLIAVPMFIFMGTMLERSGVADELLKALQVLTRRIPGGLAMSVTIMGTIMAATTGIVGASVIMLTLIALPPMLAAGYSKELSVGTIASAGTLGILIPPSIMLVIMADLMSLSVGTLFTAAIVPGVLMSLIFLIYIGIFAFLRPQSAPPLHEDIGPKTTPEFLRMIFKSFLPPAFLIVVVLGSIFGGFATPTEAGGMGSIGAMLLAWWNKRLNWKTIREVIDSAALTNGLVFFIVFGATLFSYVFRALGGDDVVAELLKAMGINTGWETLIFVMVLVFLMGFFFDWLEICLIVMPIFAPILKVIDFEPHIDENRHFLAWFVVLVAVNLQSAFLTPPFGFALFYMKGTVPPSVTMQHIYRGIIPFVALQMTTVAVCMIWPEIILWLPRYVGFLD